MDIMDKFSKYSVVFGILYLVKNVSSGDATVWGKYPGVVAVAATSLNMTCVGHIVNSWHIVTSAQCVVDKTTYQPQNVFWYKVTAGDLKLYEPTRYRIERNVANIYPHKQYNPLTDEHDIAVLRVDSEFPYPHNTIEPVILNSKIVQTGTSCNFVGWSSDTKGQLIQQTSLLLTYDRDFCNSQMYPGMIFETVLCAQLQSDDTLLENNLGGGLYCNGELNALLTLPSPKTGASKPNIFTQIRFYQKWIKYQLARLDPPNTIVLPLNKNT